MALIWVAVLVGSFCLIATLARGGVSLSPFFIGCIGVAGVALVSAALARLFSQT